MSRNAFFLIVFIFFYNPYKIYAQQVFEVVKLDFRYGLNNSEFEGAGVGIADLNNDDLQDIVFVSYDSLFVYENLGSFNFKVVFSLKINSLSHSVTIFDINRDKKKDIIVTNNISEETKNKSAVQFFKNKGNMIFENSNSVFFGPIENVSHCYLGVLQPDSDSLIFVLPKWRAFQGIGIQSNNFLVDCHNLRPSNFEDIITVRGVLNDTIQDIGFSNSSYYNYSSFISDLDYDGYIDLFLTSDFNVPDLLYTNQLKLHNKFNFKNSSYYSMGVDIADVNNDFLKDVLVTDMRPENNYQSKTFVFEKQFNWQNLQSDCDSIFNKQQTRNTLNLGLFDKQFLEVGQLSEIDATGWSWSILAEDFNNDGFKDVFITNGNDDEHNFEFDNPYYSSLNSADKIVIYDSLSRYYKSYYKNHLFLNSHENSFVKNLQFCEESDIIFNSRGAAVGDLDNDGKIDLVLSNFKQNATVLKNITPKSNYFRVLFEEDQLVSLHAHVYIFTGDEKQTKEYYPFRGFRSTSEEIIHFGVGSHNMIDSLVIQWRDGVVNKYYKLNSNQIFKISKRKSKSEFKVHDFFRADTTLFMSSLINFSHTENEFEDFSVDPLLPNKYSRNGPGICIDDFDNDGKMDVLFGNAMNQFPAIYKLSKDSFILDQRLSANSSDNMGVAYHTGQFIIPPGGYEKADGELKGMPISDKKFDVINTIKTSSSCVAIADFNGDGKDEIFIGGRVNSHNYPKQPTSYLFAEIDGELKDVTPSDLKHIGMVTSAIWTDFDNDEAIDLVIVGEYMRVEFFKNVNGKLKRYTDNIDFGQKMDGFWNSILGADVNNDGLMDYIVGNLGMNTRYKPTQLSPLRMFANDFDSNGSEDVICTFDEDGKSFPMKQLIAYKARINGLAKKYNKVSDFANATFYDLFSPDKYKDMLQFSAHESRSGVLINKGNNKFEFQPLPIEAQFSPIYGIYSEDFNGDGLLDIATIGNFHHAEIERGSYTASNGWILLGKGDGKFQTLINSPSNFEVRGEGRALAPIEVNGKLFLIATQNNDKAKAFKLNGEYEIETMPQNKKYALIELKNGQKRKQEFYNGAGYLSNYRSVILRNSKVSKITFY